MTEGELLLRIASMLRQDIAPAIDAEYPKTQAFMAAVVLQKLGQQIALAPEHARAAAADSDALITALTASAAAASIPEGVRRTITELGRKRDAATLCRLIEALYANRTALGERRFVEMLARVRETLRADIERRMDYAE